MLSRSAAFHATLLALQSRAGRPVRTGVVVGVLFMVVGVSLLPLMNTFAKTLAAEYPLWQVVCARFSGHLLWMSLLFYPSRGMALFKTGRIALQLTRSVIFFVSNALFISALPKVALATASAVMFTTPIIVTALSVPFLGERVGVWRWAAVICGFCGTVIVIQPGTDLFNIGALLVLGSAVCFAFYQLTTRQLTYTESAETLIVYTALVGAFATALLVPAVGRLPDTLWHWICFAAVGLVGGLAQYCIVRALEKAPASVISPIGYAELISATFFGFVVFGDFPPATTWYGALLIIGSGMFIAFREARAKAPGRT
ncbi:MAG: DMT family transporter [Gammaproteobacteria bacterium]|nr:DMT family transporter [Gammaproteobacteria bacterium]